MSPTVGPTAGPSYICPEDLEVLVIEGDGHPNLPTLPKLPIILLEQSTTEIKFKLNDDFIDEFVDFYVQFHSTDTGDTICVGEDGGAQGSNYTEYTAQCLENCPITLIDFWGSYNGDRDPNLSAAVPECCRPFDDNSLPVVQYTLKIECIPQCPEDEDESRRHLSTEDTAGTQLEFTSLTNGSVDELIVDEAAAGEDFGGEDGHFCSMVDYPCGDNGDMVHVCHYSSRLGYQTFCVPEEDSDVLGFFPKDYCGPCVGGYRNSHSQTS